MNTNSTFEKCLFYNPDTGHITNEREEIVSKKEALRLIGTGLCDYSYAVRDFLFFRKELQR